MRNLFTDRRHHGLLQVIGFFAGGCIGVLLTVFAPSSHPMEVKVVESVKVEILPDRYSIPAQHVTEYIGPPHDAVRASRWVDAETIHYERWTMTAYDGFVYVEELADPRKQERPKKGDRWKAYWK